MMSTQMVGLLKHLEIVKPGVAEFEGIRRYVPTGSLETGRISDYTIVEYNPRPSRANMEVEVDDILLAKMKDTEKVFLITEKEQNYIFSTGFSILRVKDRTKFLPKFVFYWLRTKYFKNKKNQECTGATQKAIKESKLKKFELPLIPLETQKKIVSILEKAERAKQLRKEAAELTKNYLNSVFLEMFGDPIKNPKKWKVVRVNAVADSIVPGRDKPKSFTGNIPWVITDDLIYLGLTFDSKNNFRLDKSEIQQVRAKIIPKGSILMTCVGDLGVVSIAANDMVINQQLHSFQCSSEVNNVFLMFYLSFQKPHMYKMATSTTVPYMKKETCNSIPTILPPIELQNKFAQIVEQVEQLKQNQSQSSQQLDDLFDSLMQKAFRGEFTC